MKDSSLKRKILSKLDTMTKKEKSNWHRNQNKQ